MDQIDLYSFLERRFKQNLPIEKYNKVMTKIDKMIGLIYGSIIGVMCGAATQPLGPKSAERAYSNKIPFCKITDKDSIQDPVLGQLMSHINELKVSKWDPVKYKSLTNYKAIIGNTPILRIELAAQLIEQVRMVKSPNLYNLFSEDFYLRVPLCALFGDASIEVVIGKIMQTHTSFEASAYGILTTSILRLTLINDDIFAENINWNTLVNTMIMPVLESYYKIYNTNFLTLDESKQSIPEAEKLRISSIKTKLDEKYLEIIEKVKKITNLYEDNEPLIMENLDHLTDEEKEDYKISSIYQKSLNELKLESKDSAHPALLSIWTVKTLQAIHRKLNMSTIEPSDVFRLMLQSVAIKTGCSTYNCMIVGSILGNVFGFTQIPEEFYESLDIKFMNRITREIIDVIACM